MRAIAIAVSLAAAALPAQAQTSARETGVTLGARLGYGIPLGDAEKSLPLSKYASGSVPLVLEAGYRFTPQLSAGAYFQYAFAMAGSSICDAIPPAVRTSGSYCSSSSSGYVLRYGVQGAFRFPMHGMTPWAGLGVGGESAKMNTTAHIPALPGVYNAFNGDVALRRSTGVIGEVSLSGGVEWPVGSGLSIGPFATVTFASYTDASFSPNPWGLSGGIPSSDQTWHEWLVLGVKGTLDL